MNIAARRGVAVGAGAASGLALAALLVPQLATTVGPTALGTALLAILLALLTTLAQRFIERYKQRSALVSALRVWPPQPLSRADLGTLGVYPAYRADGKPRAYRLRPREEDAKLREALTHSRCVIVHGPPRVGKSRAAGEAGRHVLGAVPTVIPLDAVALRAMADGTVKVNGRAREVCLWLDGLDRFVGTLDASAVDSLSTLVRKVTIVATVRTKSWRELVAGTGQDSEAARALARRAAIIELAPRGLGAGEAEQQLAPEPEIAPPHKPHPPWMDGLILVLGAMLAATVTAMVIFGLAGDLLKPPSLSDQMAQVTSEMMESAGSGTGHVVIDQRVHLHATDEDSWLIVVEDRRTHDQFYTRAADCPGAPTCSGPPPTSDELRIYDVSAGKLHLQFDFRPAGTGSKAADLQVPSGAPVAADYDNDNAPEIIAGYAIPAQATEALVPFGIDWENGQYQLISLTPQKPQLSTAGLDANTLRFRREAYQQRITFRNGVADPSFSNLELSGYRVQAFAITQQPVPRLLSGYFATFPQYQQPTVLELHAAQIRNSTLQLLACAHVGAVCDAPAREQEVIVPTDKSLNAGLLAAWGLVGSEWFTPVKVIEQQRCVPLNQLVAQATSTKRARRDRVVSSCRTAVAADPLTSIRGSSPSAPGTPRR